MSEDYKPALWEKIVTYTIAVVIVAFILLRISKNDVIQDPNNVVMLRMLLSLALAALGATIPGFLRVDLTLKGVAIRALSAFGLFVITFFFTPQVLPTPPNPKALLQRIDSRFASEDGAAMALIDPVETAALHRRREAFNEHTKGTEQLHYSEVEPLLRDLDFGIQKALAAILTYTNWLERARVEAETLRGDASLRSFPMIQWSMVDAILRIKLGTPTPQAAATFSNSWAGESRLLSQNENYLKLVGFFLTQDSSDLSEYSITQNKLLAAAAGAPLIDDTFVSKIKSLPDNTRWQFLLWTVSKYLALWDYSSSIHLVDQMARSFSREAITNELVWDSVCGSLALCWAKVGSRDLAEQWFCKDGKEEVKISLPMEMPSIDELNRLQRPGAEFRVVAFSEELTINRVTLTNEWIKALLLQGRYQDAKAYLFANEVAGELVCRLFELALQHGGIAETEAVLKAQLGHAASIQRKRRIAYKFLDLVHHAGFASRNPREVQDVMAEALSTRDEMNETELRGLYGVIERCGLPGGSNVLESLKTLELQKVKANKATNMPEKIDFGLGPDATLLHLGFEPDDVWRAVAAWRGRSWRNLAQLIQKADNRYVLFQMYLHLVKDSAFVNYN